MSNKTESRSVFLNQTGPFIIAGNFGQDSMIDEIVSEVRSSKEDIFIFDPSRKEDNFEELKSLKKTFRIAPNDSRYKLFIIKGADQLSAVMANSLLKLLEEPPEYLKIFIFVKNEKRLLPTVRSRCSIRTLNQPIEKMQESKFLELFDKQDFTLWTGYLNANEENNFLSDIQEALVKLKKNGLNEKRELFLDLANLYMKFENFNINQKLHLEYLYLKYQH